MQSEHDHRIGKAGNAKADAPRTAGILRLRGKREP